MVLAFFELLLLAGVLALYATASEPREELQSIAALLPPGACATVYSSRLVVLNGTLYGRTVTLCRNSAGTEVVSP